MSLPVEPFQSNSIEESSLISANSLFEEGLNPMDAGTKPLLIYGAGSFARELAWMSELAVDGPVWDPLHRQTPKPSWRLLGFIDDNDHEPGEQLRGLPVMTLEQASRLYPGVAVAGGIGKPGYRQHTVERALEAGFAGATMIHHRVELARTVEVGEGTVICAGSILTTDIRLGRQVQVNVGCTICHDVILGDYSTLAPGVHISGWVHTGKRVHFGTGAVVVNGTSSAPLYIGDDAVIGAGACVTKAVPAGEVVAGVPAKPLHRSQATTN